MYCSTGCSDNDLSREDVRMLFQCGEFLEVEGIYTGRDEEVRDYLPRFGNAVFVR